MTPTALALLAGTLLAAAPGDGGPGPGREGPLLAADRDLDAAVARRDREAFLALVEPGAVFAGASLLVGRDAVWERWSRFFDPAGPTLRWRPTAGGMAASGDLGWTVGEARFTWKAKDLDEDGILYLTVWHRAADGRWAVAIDGSREGVGSGPSERTPVRTVVSRDGSMEAAIGTFARGSGAARRTGVYLVVRELRGDTWRVVQESEIPAPPSSP